MIAVSPRKANNNPDIKRMDGKIYPMGTFIGFLLDFAPDRV